jgi:hypothetical protein
MLTTLTYHNANVTGIVKIRFSGERVAYLVSFISGSFDDFRSRHVWLMWMYELLERGKSYGILSLLQIVSCKMRSYRQASQHVRGATQIYCCESNRQQPLFANSSNRVEACRFETCASVAKRLRQRGLTLTMRQLKLLPLP